MTAGLERHEQHFVDAMVVHVDDLGVEAVESKRLALVRDVAEMLHNESG